MIRQEHPRNANRADLSFNDFLFNLAPLAVVLIVVFIGLCRIRFRSAFVYDEDRAADIMGLDEREVIRDGGLLVRSMIVLFLVVVGFVAHSALHVEPSLVALLGAGALVAVSRREPVEYLEEVEWPTWALAAGADLGGNATAVGASANVVIIGIAARNGHHISFWKFTKYGLIVASVTIAISWPYIWLRYYALG